MDVELLDVSASLFFLCVRVSETSKVLAEYGLGNKYLRGFSNRHPLLFFN